MVGGGGGTSFLLGLGLFGSASENFDVCYDKEAIDQAYKNREGLTWKERVELMWRRDEFGHSSPELQVLS